MTEEYDILIKNALIIDGTGSPPAKGSLAVKDERISAVGKVKGGAEAVIDAKGMAVTPGWIDVHNHGDMSIIYYPKADGFVRQGITTFVGGNCGSSPGPFGDLVTIGMMADDLLDEIAPDMYYPGHTLPRNIVNLVHKKKFGWEIDWHTMGEFFNKLEKKGISPNYVPLVGHHCIRTIVMGHDSHRAATSSEVKKMAAHVEQAMKDGCHGLSAGRDYEPSHYGDLNELVALAKVAAKYNGIYAAHSLRTGLRKSKRPGQQPPSKVGGLLETIDVGRKAKLPVQVSHLGALHDVYPMNDKDLMEAAARATLKIVDEANKEGIDVSFDQIPGVRAYGLTQSQYLVGTLLPWLKVAGSREQLGKALRMPEFRQEIKETCWSGKYNGINPNSNPNWAGGITVAEHKNATYKGKNIATIAKEENNDPFEVLFDTIIADPDAKVGGAGMGSSTKWMFYQHPRGMIGIDTLAIDATWMNTTPPWVLPSENSFNGWAMYWHLVVRESKTLTLEQAVYKATGAPASKFKLKDRGILKPGYYADIVVFNPETIIEKCTLLNPATYPDGIPYVIVNGKLVVADSTHTGATPGKVLRRE